MLLGAGIVAGIVAAIVASMGPASAGSYDDPFFLGWSAFTPAVPTDYTTSTEHDCPNGSIQCVDNLIREMARRYNALGCHHDSAFALTYLLTTEEYRKASSEPGFFVDPGFVNHQDLVFADEYFKARDAWVRGQIANVPPAWRIAFRASAGQEVTGMGGVLLGMNAHVNRDLPFVLNAIGLTRPDGTSRKVDHDRVNAFLNAVNKYLLTEAAKYLDPTIDDGDVPGTTIDNSAAVQLLYSWREGAWRNAERLAAATSDADRLRIAAEIEDGAAAVALTLRQTYRYDGLLNGTAAARNTYCATHWQSH
jgi:hypothetical protein